MDFYAVLDEVLQLLQRHKRVTYRALKRQCVQQPGPLFSLRGTPFLKAWGLRLPSASRLRGCLADGVDYYPLRA